MVTLNLAITLVLYDKSRPMQPTSFYFIPPHLELITHTLHHNTTLIAIHSSLEFSLTHHPEVMQKYKMCHTLACIRSKAGPKFRKYKRWQLYTGSRFKQLLPILLDSHHYVKSQFTWFFSSCFLVSCAPFSKLCGFGRTTGTAKHWKWYKWHQKSSAKTQVN